MSRERAILLSSWSLVDYRNYLLALSYEMHYFLLLCAAERRGQLGQCLRFFSVSHRAVGLIQVSGYTLTDVTFTGFPTYTYKYIQNTKK